MTTVVSLLARHCLVRACDSLGEESATTATAPFSSSNKTEASNMAVLIERHQINAIIQSTTRQLITCRTTVPTRLPTRTPNTASITDIQRLALKDTPKPPSPQPQSRSSRPPHSGNLSHTPPSSAAPASSQSSRKHHTKPSQS
jgi:hypothetical protein